MRTPTTAVLLFVVLGVGSSSVAQEAGVTRPNLVLRDVVQGMPKGDLFHT